MEKDEHLQIKLKGIMEYYVKQYFEAHEDKLKEEMSKLNPGIIDPEMLDIQIDQYVEFIIVEATEKFHSLAFLVLNMIASGQEPTVREFEVLFIDLVKRTLIKETKERERAVQPISIIIEDPKVSGTKES
jgi:hypothetical protein